MINAPYLKLALVLLLATQPTKSEEQNENEIKTILLERIEKNLQQKISSRDVNEHNKRELTTLFPWIYPPTAVWFPKPKEGFPYEDGNQVPADEKVPTAKFPWKGMPTEGFPWKGMHTEGFPWKGMPTEGFPWKGMPTEGFPWKGMPTEGLNPSVVTEGFKNKIQTSGFSWEGFNKLIGSTTPFPIPADWAKQDIALEEFSRVLNRVDNNPSSAEGSVGKGVRWRKSHVKT